jgi:hypothetical protein
MTRIRNRAGANGSLVADAIDGERRTVSRVLLRLSVAASFSG